MVEKLVDLVEETMEASMAGLEASEERMEAPVESLEASQAEFEEVVMRVLEKAQVEAAGVELAKEMQEGVKEILMFRTRLDFFHNM